MKFGILNIYINTSCNTNRANGLEIYYLRKALLEAGHEVSIIGHKNLRNADQEYYVDANEAEWETYDGIFIQLAKDNFFGGGFENHRLFWETLIPNGDKIPGGLLEDQIVLWLHLKEHMR